MDIVDLAKQTAQACTLHDLGQRVGREHCLLCRVGWAGVLGFQKLIASIVTVVGVLAALSTIATGIDNASAFLCTRRISFLSCPVP
jgi:hypothetical protein